MKSNNSIFSIFKKKKVYALVGRSGTGKSFRAKLIAQKYGIDYIIDDGLLIYKKSILGGKSAKKEDLYLKAIKTAIFEDPKHRKEVADLIHGRKIQKILIIGTSEKMIKIICDRMNLPSPSKIIRIEDISSQEEIARAIESRTRDGKHVIPVSTIEVKRNYPNTIAESLQLFFTEKLKFRKKKKSTMVEKSVIRPDFTLNGVVSISESALAQMIYHCADEFNADYVLKKITIKMEKGKYNLHILLKIPMGQGLAENLHEFKSYIISSIEKYTGIMIGKVDLEITEVK